MYSYNTELWALFIEHEYSGLTSYAYSIELFILKPENVAHGFTKSLTDHLEFFPFLENAIHKVQLNTYRRKIPIFSPPRNIKKINQIISNITLIDV